MRRRSSWVGVALAWAVLGTGAAVTGGCLLFTGSTDGYEAADAAVPTGTCASNADCPQAEGEGGAEVCCLGITTSGIGTGCALGSTCPLGTVATCEIDAGCGLGACMPQTCTTSTSTAPLSFNACLLLPGCTYDGPDAAGVDAGKIDAGTTDAGDAGITDASDSG